MGPSHGALAESIIRQGVPRIPVLKMRFKVSRNNIYQAVEDLPSVRDVPFFHIFPDRSPAETDTPGDFGFIPVALG